MHPFLELLSTLSPNASGINQALNEFSLPKDRTIANFKIGVKRFIELATMSIDERDEFYGSVYAGLYNNNNLAQVWNVDCEEEEIIDPHDLDSIVGEGWNISSHEGSIAYVYLGSKPAEALNKLIKGSVIDCGMFCQLGIWFGLRYILGDEAFDSEFGHAPFWITRSNFEYALEENMGTGNPLYSFFTDVCSEDTVSIEHVFNDMTYRYKHIGGTKQGQNSLVIDNQYYIFSSSGAQHGLSREEVVLDLIESFNAPPDDNDTAAITVLYNNPEFFESQYGSIYHLEFSSLIWFRLLCYNRPTLLKYADLLDAEPDCHASLNTLFQSPMQTGKEGFIASFSSEERAIENQDQYETLYALSQTKDLFKKILVDKPLAFQVYYKGIVMEFIRYIQNFASHTLTLESYYERQAYQSVETPSFIHFNFNQFMQTLHICRGLSPVPSSSPETKRRKRDDDLSPLVLTPYGALNVFNSSVNAASDDNQPFERHASVPALGGADEND